MSRHLDRAHLVDSFCISKVYCLYLGTDRDKVSAAGLDRVHVFSQHKSLSPLSVPQQYPMCIQKEVAKGIFIDIPCFKCPMLMLSHRDYIDRGLYLVSFTYN